MLTPFGCIISSSCQFPYKKLAPNISAQKFEIWVMFLSFYQLSLDIRKVFSSNTMATLSLFFGVKLIGRSVPFLRHRFVVVLFLSFFDILLYSEVMQYDCIQEFVVGGNAYFLLCRFLQTFTPFNFIGVSHLKAVQVCETWLSAVSSKNTCLFFSIMSL